MKPMKRLIAALLAALLCFSISGCNREIPPSPDNPPENVEKEDSGKSENQETGQEETSNSEPKPEFPTSYATVEEMQAAFDDFILQEFVDSLDGDYLAIHQSLLHPEKYGIDLDSAEVTLGDVITEAYLEEARQENNRLKEQLGTFDYVLLTEEQQETYLVYQYLLENAIAGFEGDFPYMGGAFTPMQGLQTSIVSILMEYDFYTLRDAEAYLEMMRDIPRYVDGMLEFTKVQAEKGYFMPDVAAQSTLDYCKKILKAGEDSALLSAVLHNLETCDLLTDAQKIQYQAEARSIFSDCILPSYQKIYDTIESLMGKGGNQLGLCYLKNGKEYYQYLFRVKSASSRSVDEAKKLLQKYLDLSIQSISTIAMNNKPTYRQYIYEGALMDYDGIGDMLNDLETYIWQDFPYIEPVDYTVDYLDPEVAVDGVTAYYVVPPLDSEVTQKIKVNPNADLDETQPSTFTVLAHEGLPGHLYQTNYVLQNLENPFRQSVSILGYSEGYATYAELVSLNYLQDLDPDMITLEQSYTLFQNCLIALCDIGIHYEGWDVADMQNFMNQYVSIEDATAIYNQLLGDPAGFQAYYMGCVEFLELRRQAQEALGQRFDAMKFHSLILEGGDLPFSLLQSKLTAYINEAKG